MKENRTRKFPLWAKILLIALAAVVTVVVIYFAYVFIAYYRLEDRLPLDVEHPVEPTAETGKAYTVVTWNMGFGAYSDDYSFFMDGGKYSRAFSEQAAKDNIAAMAMRLSELKPDFALVQEVDVDSTRSYHVDETSMLADAMDGYTHIFAQNYDSPYLFYPILSPHGKSVSGLMIFSSCRVESSLRRQLPIETGLTRLLDLDRCYSVSRIPVEGGRTLCLYNMHLSAYTSDGTIATEQVKMLIEDMRAEYEAGNYVVCGGDFNKDLLGDSSKIFGVSGEDYTWAQPFPTDLLPTWLTLVACDNAPSCRNADRPYDDTNFILTVDGFLISANVTPVDAAVVDEAFAHSDHNPVRMTFILNP